MRGGRIIKRGTGTLMHISSLPGKYGIGDFGNHAYEFVDFLEKSALMYWQVLPMGMTGYGDSPYQSFSAFAGNIYFIDLDEFIKKDYLTREDIEGSNLGQDPLSVDYGLLYKNKIKLLKIAYGRAKKQLHNELIEFYMDNKDWLRSFALFMAIKDFFGGDSWQHWPGEYKKYDSNTVLKFEEENRDAIFFWIFTQKFFYQQWLELKKYANDKGIEIIGDLPIYVSEDSADLWSRPELFNLDNNLLPKTVAGCPPDAFSKDGQLWGNPIYDWQALKSENYKWWFHRIEHSLNLYNYLRIDHFIGFERYYEIPYGVRDARLGKYTKGPGRDFFKNLKDKLGSINIIVEDLGILTQEVRDLIKFTGYPGMRVLQFAFDSKEDNEYLPHNYEKNSIAYTGTHDNDTSLSWINKLSGEKFKYVEDYLKLTKDEGYNWGMVRGILNSKARIAIVPMQDYLGLEDEGRMNTPSKIEGNWKWRIDGKSLDDKLAKKIARLNYMYERRNTVKILVFLAEGFEEVEALTVVDYLRRMDITVDTISIGKEEEVKGAHDIIVRADKLMDDLVDLDYDGLVIPGGLPGSTNLRDNPRVIEIVKNIYDNDKLVSAICAGPLVLKRAGIIEGKKMTSYPALKDEFTNSIYREENVVLDKNIITGRGPALAVDFAIEIVKYLLGEEKAETLKEDILY